MRWEPTIQAYLLECEKKYNETVPEYLEIIKNQEQHKSIFTKRDLISPIKYEVIVEIRTQAVL